MAMKNQFKNRRDLTRTRQRILDAAAREFAEHGLPGARVDDIARRARANKRDVLQKKISQLPDSK